MKRYFKILALAISAVMLFTLFVSCAENSEEKKKETLLVATNAEFPPFETKEGDEYLGFDIDLINEIAKKLDMEVKFSNMEFESVISSVQTGSCKIAISGLTINDKRKESVDFSNPYYTVSQIIIVKKDDTVFTGTTKDELDATLIGKKIGVCAGFTGADYVAGSDDYPGIKDAERKSYDNINLAIQDLKNGAIDCIVMDDVVAKTAASKNADSVKAIDVSLTTENYGIAIKKGDSEMKNKIDIALAELKSNGFIDSLIKKWIDNE